MTSYARLGVSATVLLGAIAFLYSFQAGAPVPIRKPLEEFPRTLGRWQGREDSKLTDDVLRELKLSDYVLRRYVSGAGDGVWLYVGYWDTQRRGAQIHSPKHCLPGGGWNALEADRVAIPIPGETKAITVNRYVMQKESSYMMVAYWFQAQGEAIASELDAKIALVRNSVVHQRSDAALVRVTAAFQGDPERTWARLVDYIQSANPALKEFLPE